jgi:hypothetical protein
MDCRVLKVPNTPLTTETNKPRFDGTPGRSPFMVSLIYEINYKRADVHL